MASKTSQPIANQALKVLYEPFKLGNLSLKNRFVMAAMTRCRADDSTGAPSELHAEYYGQRAGAGLILTECTPVSRSGTSFLGVAGIYTEDQAKGWRKTIDTVHAKDSKIFAQIWHAGRANVPALTGAQSIAPSSIAIKGDLFPGIPYAVPQEMTKKDIDLVLDQFTQGAKNAKKAGFDGLELHGANGYLVDEFLRTSANQRKDEYGGSAENRARFPLQVIDRLIDVFGPERVGIKLSPVGRYQDMYDENPLETYSYLLKELNKKKIAFVELSEVDTHVKAMGDWKAPIDQLPEVTKTLKPYFNGTIIINNNQTPENAAKAINEGYAHLVSHARNWLANPDYEQRVRNNWPLNQVDFATAYSAGPKGYTDYPFYQA